MVPSGSALTNRKTAGVFVAPLVAVTAALILVPMTGTLISSLHQQTTFMPYRFVGLENFRELMSDGAFLQSLRFTLLFTAVSVPMEMFLGLLLALALNEALPMRGLMRAAVLLPWAVPTVVSARLWELIYNYHYGAANWILLGTGITSEPVNWLGSSFSAFSALVVADAWKTAPFVALILLAGLQSIPGELYEQARVDGAGRIQRLTRLTLPLLRSTLLVALLFRTVDALRVFDLITLTRGGPGGATASLSHHACSLYLGGDFGRGAAVSSVLFVVALAVALVLLRIGKFRESVA